MSVFIGRLNTRYMDVFATEEQLFMANVDRMFKLANEVHDFVQTEIDLVNDGEIPRMALTFIARDEEDVNYWDTTNLETFYGLLTDIREGRLSPSSQSVKE